MVVYSFKMWLLHRLDVQYDYCHFYISFIPPIFNGNQYGKVEKYRL